MRSDPLILNKKGNIKYLLQTQRKKMRWMLVVTDLNGKNRGKKFHKYSQAKKVMLALKERHPDSEYTIVSRQVGYGPPASRISDEYLMEMNMRGRWWCPYCRKFRVFDYDPNWGLDRCPVCRIMETNACISKNNPLVTRR